MSGDASSAGILYSCSGEHYIAEALRSARSSLRHNDVPHVMFASPVPADADADHRLSFEPFEPSDNPYVDRIANLRRSPFERTIYLDSDTYVVNEIAHIFELLDRYDLAAAHAAGYRGFPDPDVPKAFYELNAGVLALRTNERTTEFLADWQATYLAWLEREPFAGASRAGGGDQPALRHCAWKHGLRTTVLGPEYNFRITKPGTLVGNVRVLHGRHPNHAALAARLNKRQGTRIYAGSVRALAGSLRQRYVFRPDSVGHGNTLKVGRSIARVLLRR